MAKRLNVSPDKLKSAFQAAFSDRLDAAVAAGKLTRAQADAIKQRVQQNDGIPFLGRPHPFFGGPRGPFVAGRLLDLSEGAARAIGGIGAGLIHVRIRVVALPEGTDTAAGKPPPH